MKKQLLIFIKNNNFIHNILSQARLYANYFFTVNKTQNFLSKVLLTHNKLTMNKTNKKITLNE